MVLLSYFTGSIHLPGQLEKKICLIQLPRPSQEEITGHVKTNIECQNYVNCSCNQCLIPDSGANRFLELGGANFRIFSLKTKFLMQTLLFNTYLEYTEKCFDFELLRH